ncbi:MAG: serine hydrolase, partial [Flavobacteriales bacterium]|nr:serine hydrolase [Flavobacteriales bacterium]
TSSYGAGNYDVYIIKTDKEGKKLWQNSYGEAYNDYGYTAEKTDDGFLIRGVMQKCPNNDSLVEGGCANYVYVIKIDDHGKLLSQQVLEEVK